MYEMLIKNYLKRLSLKDINDFANKQGITLPIGEDKIIYDLIMKYWKDIYNGDTTCFNDIKKKVSNDTYNVITNLYNTYKDKLKG